MTLTRPQVTLGDPIVVAQGPAGVRHWGPWQFPNLYRQQDGRLCLSHHLELDSSRAYGLPRAQYLSSDEGRSWTRLSEPGPDGGVTLPNGDQLRNQILRPRPASELSLPEHALMSVGSYGQQKFYYYRVHDLPEELQDGWHFMRQQAGSDDWVEERASVDLPGELRRIQEGVLVFPWLWATTIAPNGTLWGIEYGRREQNGTIYAWHAIFLYSTDGGRNWAMRGEILPEGFDPQRDRAWNRRDGFTEPAITFLPDGSVYCLLRTTDGNGPGPMYWSRSTDDGVTWSKPLFFDPVGVWPQLLTLRSGVTLVSYGRPGVYVRGTSDPSAAVWGDPVTVLPPGEVGKDSCSYTGLVALDDRTALLAYSDFNYPDAEGTPRKTILVRTVHV